MKTWKEMREELPEGLCEEAIELIRKATAQERHEDRVQAVLAVVIAQTAPTVPMSELAQIMCAPSPIVALPSDPALYEQASAWCRRAAALIAIERNGCGGPRGCGSYGGTPSTLRMLWARDLGSGRRHASDGDAWDAAMLEAIGRLVQPASSTDAYYDPTEEDVGELIMYVAQGDLEFLVSYCRSRICWALDKAPQHLVSWSSVLVQVRAEQAPAPDQEPVMRAEGL